MLQLISFLKNCLQFKTLAPRTSKAMKLYTVKANQIRFLSETFHLESFDSKEVLVSRGCWCLSAGVGSGVPPGAPGSARSCSSSSERAGAQAAPALQEGFGCGYRMLGADPAHQSTQSPRDDEGSLLLRTEVLLKHSLKCLRFLWFLYFFLLVVFCFLPKNKSVTSHADPVCTGQGLLCAILHTVPVQKNLPAASSGALTVSRLGEDGASPFHGNSDHNRNNSEGAGLRCHVLWSLSCCCPAVK